MSLFIISTNPPDPPSPLPSPLLLLSLEIEIEAEEGPPERSTGASAASVAKPCVRESHRTNTIGLLGVRDVILLDGDDDDDADPDSADVAGALRSRSPSPPPPPQAG